MGESRNRDGGSMQTARRGNSYDEGKERDLLGAGIDVDCIFTGLEGI